MSLILSGLWKFPIWSPPTFLPGHAVSYKESCTFRIMPAQIPWKRLCLEKSFCICSWLRAQNGNVQALRWVSNPMTHVLTEEGYVFTEIWGWVPHQGQGRDGRGPDARQEVLRAMGRKKSKKGCFVETARKNWPAGNMMISNLGPPEMQENWFLLLQITQMALLAMWWF